MASAVPSITLNSGYSMPVVGFGTYFGTPKDYTPDSVRKSIESAIDVGYRSFDTAVLYQTEPFLGQAIKNKIEEGIVKREDLFITSKLPFSHHHPEDAAVAVEQSLKDLGLAYIDLYLVHTPFATERLAKGEAPDPASASGIMLSKTNDHLRTWRVLEGYVKRGIIRSIGVSNFNKRQIQNILDNCDVRPCMNQVEVQPYFANTELLNYCKEKGIGMTAYTPLGQPHSSWAPPGWVTPLENQVLVRLAAKHGKSPAQVAMKLQVQRGCVVVAKSSNPKRQLENLQLFDFELSRDDMQALMALDQNSRMNTFNAFKEHKDYPFNDPY